MNILCCGDSHSLVFNYCNKKQNDFVFDVCCVRGASSIGSINPKSKTNSLNIFEKKIKSTTADKILIMLGEVDCGFVIWLRSKKYNASVDKQINISINNLLKFIHDIVLKKSKFRKEDVIVCGSILPTIKDSTNKKNLSIYRKNIHISHLERTKKTLEYNNLLKERCSENGYKYIDITKNTIGKNGLIKNDFLLPDTKDPHLNEKESYKLWLSEVKDILN